MEKPKCNYYDVCGLYADTDEEPPLCILHSKNPNKQKEPFNVALKKHRSEKGDDFRWFFFPEIVDFSRAKFSKRANFAWATFSEEANFSRSTFFEGADFSDANFGKGANFSMATFSNQAIFFNANFSEKADFSGAAFSNLAVFAETTFSEQAIFTGATFSEEEAANFAEAKFFEKAIFFSATFSKWAAFPGATFFDQAGFKAATFTEQADFAGARFFKEADFASATFTGRGNFLNATFLAKTTFIGQYPKGKKPIPIFSGIKNEVNFRGVNVDPPQALIFRDADLSKCLFEQTDLRKAEFTGVKWPKPEKGFRIYKLSWPKPDKRFRVYDEICPLKTGETRRWDHIERLYRELKQNHEDRRDYERAGDFHYGEKKMRRKNPDTPVLLKCLLTLYCWVSGYGERYVRPLVWAFGLLVLCTFGYLFLGIAPPDKVSTPLALTNWKDWFRVGLYSLQVMTLLKPAYLIPLGTKAICVKVVQSLLGPIIIGLFALAVRQRLKR